MKKILLLIIFILCINFSLGYIINTEDEIYIDFTNYENNTKHNHFIDMRYVGTIFKMNFTESDFSRIIKEDNNSIFNINRKTYDSPSVMDLVLFNYSLINHLSEYSIETKMRFHNYKSVSGLLIGIDIDTKDENNNYLFNKTNWYKDKIGIKKSVLVCLDNIFSIQSVGVIYFSIIKNPINCDLNEWYNIEVDVELNHTSYLNDTNYYITIWKENETKPEDYNIKVFGGEFNKLICNGTIEQMQSCNPLKESGFGFRVREDLNFDVDYIRVASMNDNLLLNYVPSNETEIPIPPVSGGGGGSFIIPQQQNIVKNETQEIYKIDYDNNKLLMLILFLLILLSIFYLLNKYWIKKDKRKKIRIRKFWTIAISCVVIYTILIYLTYMGVI